MKPTRKATNKEFLGVFRREPEWLGGAAGLLLVLAGGLEEPVALLIPEVWLDNPEPAVGEDWTFGHAFEFTWPPLTAVVPSAVPSLFIENLAQVGSVIICCCDTWLSIAFCATGLNGLPSFWLKVKLDWYELIP